MDSLCYPWFTTQQPISPIGFLFLKLPPPPCAVLLVCHRHLGLIFSAWTHPIIDRIWPSFWYPLVYIQKAIENGYRNSWVFPLNKLDLSIKNGGSFHSKLGQFTRGYVSVSPSLFIPPSFIQLFEDVPRHMPGSEHRDCHSFVLCCILLLSFFFGYVILILYCTILSYAIYIYMGLLAVWKLDMPRENADCPMDFEHPRWPSRKRTLWNGRYQAPILGCRWSRTDDLFLREGLDINQIDGIWPISFFL